MTAIDPNVVDTLLAQGLRERAADLGDEDRFYQRVLATIAALPQRRWFGRSPAGFGRRLASDTPRSLTSRRGVTLLAAAALVGALVGSAAIGARLLTQPPVGPSQPPSLLPTQIPSPLPSGLQSDQPSIAPATGRIVYTRWRTLARGEEDCTLFACHRANVFVSNDDGSDERELIPDNGVLLAASPDGSRLIVSIRDGVYLTDANGTTPEALCPCLAGGPAFSPDGARLAYVRALADERSVIEIMDMLTGEVVQLASTVGIAASPGWSPDGSRLVFANHVIDADGSDLQQVAPANLFTGISGEFEAGLAASQWSPDGSLIAFTSFNDTFPTNPPERNSQRLMDIYVVRPDGAHLQRLTTDTVGPLGTNEAGDFGAAFPTWTRDGQIAFSRYPAQSGDFLELWVMDADGSNSTRVDQSNATALTALGCVSCTYPELHQWPAIPFIAFWIPAR